MLLRGKLASLGIFFGGVLGRVILKTGATVINAGPDP